MKFDDITILLGEFGKYQKRLYFLVCIPAMFCGMQMYSSVFTLATPDHRCRIPSLHNDTYTIQGDWHKALINKTIPLEHRDGIMSSSACERYIPHNETDNNVPSRQGNVSTERCNQWVYDTSVFQSTFLTQVDVGCEKGFARANANMILMAGVLVGAMGIGVFADLFGRKMAMMVSILLHMVGGFGSSFAPNYVTFVAFRFIVGIGNMGIFSSSFVIGMELVGPSKRVVVGIIIWFFWCFGECYLNIVAYFMRHWNILQLILVCPTPLLLTYFWIIPESARWLLSRDRIEEAEKVIQKCAEVNGVTLPENVVDKDTTDKGTADSVKKMFKSIRLLVMTLIIFYNWCVVSMVYYGLGLYVGNLDGNIYINFAINTSTEVVAYMMCLLVLERIGRRALYAGTMITGGVACMSSIFTMLYADESLFWITVAQANIGKFGISAAYAIIFIWSAELFPTIVRNSGMGFSAMMSCVGGMICPYIADLGNLVQGDFGSVLPLVIFGGLSVVAGALSLFLPETKGQTLPETTDDALKFGKFMCSCFLCGEDPEKSSKTKYVLWHTLNGKREGEKRVDNCGFLRN